MARSFRNFVSESAFLKAADIRGGRMLVTVSAVDVEPVGVEKVTKVILTFTGIEKRMTMNMTNLEMVASIAGTDDIDRWPGVSFELYIVKVPNPQGQMVDGIRILPPPQQPRATAARTTRRGRTNDPAPAPANSDEDPF